MSPVIIEINTYIYLKKYISKSTSNSHHKYILLHHNLINMYLALTPTYCVC